MRLIDADKLLEDMETGKAPLVGYVPRDWIMETPTVPPSWFEFIDHEKVFLLVQSLLDKSYQVVKEEYDFDKPRPYPKHTEIHQLLEYKTFRTLDKLSKSLFIDPKALRGCIEDIRWCGARDLETGQWLIEDDDFKELVEIAFPAWDKERKKKVLTPVD